MTLFVIITLIILFTVLILSASYNSLIHRKNALHYAYNGLETMLQKRYDVLPKLAEVVKTSALFEQQLIQQASALAAGQEYQRLPAGERMRKENQLVLSIQEITQELAKDGGVRQQKSFMHLQRSIVEVEEQIAAARRAYNAAAMEYNNAIVMFPSVVFAILLGYEPVDPLDLMVLNAEYTEL
ncbi:MAG: LemA protein [Saprospiraceae bacterium]|nr:MAG: LemA protein [Saprospiraceae bacterium]